MALRRPILIFLLCGGISGCLSQARIDCPGPEFVQSLDTIYFGADSPGGEISDGQWQVFVDTEITPRFPLGLTHWKASGQWQDPDSGQIIKELSRVLQIARDPSAATTAKIVALMDAYIAQFEQSSVLRVHHLSCMHIQSSEP